MWWHWCDGRPLHPVVVGFEYYLYMWVELRIVARHGDCPSELVLRGRIGNRVLAGGVTDFPDELPGDRLLVLWPDDPLPYGGAVRQWTMPIQFDYSVDGGRRWHMLRYAGPTAWYVVPSAWSYYVEKPYDLGFEKVAQYAAGRSDTHAIATAITSGIDREIVYDPDDRVIYSHALDAYEQQPPRPTQCWNHAKLLEYLIGVSGLMADFRTTWGGAAPDRADLYVAGGTFRINRAAHDRAPANPSFTYHAVVVADGAYYDPSYGDSTPPTFTEVCQPYSVDQYGLVTCNPPNPQYVPRQRWGTDLPADWVIVPCGGAAPPP